MRFSTIKIMIVAAFVAVFGVGVFAQDVAMTRAEWEKVLTTLNKASEGMSFRQSAVVEEVIDGVPSPEKTRQEILEEVPPDRTRQIGTVIINGEVERTEWITIGDRSWTRTNNGRWSIDNSGRSGDDRAAIVAAEGYSSKGKAVLAGVEYRIYEKAERLTVQRSGVIGRENQFATTIIWIDRDGLCIREFYKLEFPNTKYIYRRTATNEYNPKDLKIEAPMK
ncbi:MAG: hypothetical protein IPK01_17320 [Acidobacteria bacterium]|nr:hypothetical protein [Acidobacteriota bacterium]